MLLRFRVRVVLYDFRFSFLKYDENYIVIFKNENVYFFYRELCLGSFWFERVWVVV